MDEAMDGRPAAQVVNMRAARPSPPTDPVEKAVPEAAHEPIFTSIRERNVGESDKKEVNDQQRP